MNAAFAMAILHSVSRLHLASFVTYHVTQLGETCMLLDTICTQNFVRRCQWPRGLSDSSLDGTAGSNPAGDLDVCLL